ncbi:hypothetical protein QN277_010593 [Acacia crassicarpa]|uniref:Uncharacterized protein n=1 Tax=Acacia crassicarpa TaxID=499986 RepID=A0AAE1M671_9FABA|nr:hypothetical protein QN277_010593 [Acacia crassicarpa]
MTIRDSQLKEYEKLELVNLSDTETVGPCTMSSALFQVYIYIRDQQAQVLGVHNNFGGGNKPTMYLALCCIIFSSDIQFWFCIE